MRRSRRWFALACVAAGCERAPRDTKTIELATPEVVVTMLDLGRAPRAPLVSRPAAGTERRWDVTESIDYTLAGSAVSGSTVRHTLAMRIVDVADDGAIHGRATVTAASIDPHPGAPPIQREDAASYIGRRIDQWRDPRGRVVRPTQMTLKTDATYDDASRDLETLTIAPEPPIGDGARWHERVTVGDRSADIDLELVSRDGDRVRSHATFHTTQVIHGLTASEDGEATADEDLATLDVALHKTVTITIPTPRGDLVGHETIDYVVAP